MLAPVGNSVASAPSAFFARVFFSTKKGKSKGPLVEKDNRKG
jgi:hypothetical protein